MSSSNADSEGPPAESSSDGDRTDAVDGRSEDIQGEDDQSEDYQSEGVADAGRSVPKLAALGLVAGLAGGIAGTTLDPGHPLLTAIAILAVAAGVTLLASRLSLRRLRRE